MKIIEYDSEKLIQFYKDNNIEINEEHGYYGTNLKSFAIIENEDIVGAVTISKYDSKNFIEVIAVNKDSRGKGYGNILLNKGIEQFDNDIYVISKKHDFYLTNRFEFIEGLEYMISDNCQVCEEYNKTCFPKVMMLKRNKVIKMDIVYRKATLIDLKEVQQLNYKLFDLEYNNFDPALNMEWTFSKIGEDYFKELIKDGTVWVAVDNNKVIGYLAGSIDGKTSYATKSVAELDNFYVEEDYRRLGIGKRLVEEFKNYCVDKGIEEMKVTASAKNMNAREFYQKSGFEDFEVTYKIKLEEK